MPTDFDAALTQFLPRDTPPQVSGPIRLDGLGGLEAGSAGGLTGSNPPNPSNQYGPRPDGGVSRHVAEALPFLSMSLGEFRARGALLEVRTPWLDVTLWMVPADRDVAALMAEGVRRGRIWTAAELMQFMAIGDRTPETVQTVTRAKLELDGEITEVRRRADIPTRQGDQS